MPNSASRETARVVLRLDAAISAFLAGQRSGVPALDIGGRSLPEVSDDRYARAGARKPVPIRPDRIELTILSALADSYGSEMLTNSSLGYVLRLVARDGGVALVQRVLWGMSPSDL